MLKKIEPIETRDDSKYGDGSLFFIGDSNNLASKSMAPKGNFIKPKLKSEMSDNQLRSHLSSSRLVAERGRSENVVYYNRFSSSITPEYQLYQDAYQPTSQFSNTQIYNDATNAFDFNYQTGFDVTRNTHSVPSFNKLTKYSNPLSIYGVPIANSCNQNHMHRSSSSSREPRIRSFSGCLASPTSNREHNHELKKTKLCDHWKKSGHCSFGASCWYAHGEFDLRKNIYYNDPFPRGSCVLSDENGKFKKNLENSENVMLNSSTSASTLKTFKIFDDSAKPTSKRASTNVKGLTVSIPTNNTNSEDNLSMPLSPAQERWISMSVGSTSNASGNAVSCEKSDENLTITSSTSTVVGINDENHVNNRVLYEKRNNQGLGSYSGMEKHYGNQFYAKNSPHTDEHHSRFSTSTNTLPQFSLPAYPNVSLGRKAQPRNSVTGPSQVVYQWNGSKSLRSSSNFGTNLEQNFCHFSPVQRKTIMAPSADPEDIAPYIYVKPSPSEYPRNHGVFADDIYRKQRGLEPDVKFRIHESGQAHGYKSNNHSSHEDHNSHFNRRKEQEEIQIAKQIQFGKLARMSSIPDHHEGPWQHPNYRGIPVPPPTAYSANDRRQEMSRQHAAMIMQQKLHQHQQQQQRQYQQQQQQQYYQKLHSRPPPSLNRNPVVPDCHYGPQFSVPNKHTRFDFEEDLNDPSLETPTKIPDTLLPDDKAFSIWLDLKPKKEETSEMRSSSSFYNRMSSLKADSVPVQEPEDPMQKIDEMAQNLSTVHSESGSGSPVVSLYDLLSSENLFEGDTEQNRKKSFNFDFLEGKTNVGTLISSTSALYIDGDKTPMFDKKTTTKSNIMSPPLLADDEQCFFFATGGTCPFGDSCVQTHNLKI